ncbi:MAG: tRNA lysidine(34) synthetase TilS [Acidobacteriaceae bacterium]|jgi:tRNA(Ile)-lysidine synthase
MKPPLPTLNREHIRPGDRICAAVSGGADSVALLLLLHEENTLPRNSLGVGLSAIHVHHGLRGDEADADLAFVRDLCLRLDVPLHIHHTSVPDRLAATRAAGQPETTEEAARHLRYGVFAGLIAQGHADSILTAHTLDDQAETVLMKLLRGAWTEGLSGIHPIVPIKDFASPRTEAPKSAEPKCAANRSKPSGQILRPLLAVRRADLVTYLESRNQPWRTDLTNADQAFTRNRIRHHLLPILREYNPSIDCALANLAVLAREDEARWQSELARILPQLLLPGKPVRGGGRAVASTPGEAAVAVDLARLRELDPTLRRRVLRAAARQLGVRLTFDETTRLLALAGVPAASNPADPTVSARSGATLHLSSQLRAERSAREIRLHHAPKSSP